MRERWSNTSVAPRWLAAALVVGLTTAAFVMTDLMPFLRGQSPIRERGAR